MHIRIDFMHRHLIGSSTRINGKYSGLVAVVHEDRRDPRQHIVRVLAGRASPAFSLVLRPEQERELVLGTASGIDAARKMKVVALR
ncbi:hypothetical protein ACGF3K_21840, partial [Streptomyces sp. NPDC047980]|uniref:hypothetical protein n=1 Tax=Streptomyces sp. NPDC047980 TaxID=3365494 RepID=UPI003713DBD1